MLESAKVNSMANQPLIEVDGSFGEGGGQILRTALSLSAVTRKPCRVFNIRAGREKPGLALQHLLGVQTISQLCNGKLEGDNLGSTEIFFYPDEILAKNFEIKIDTAASITLLLQALIPPALFSPQNTEISFDGGATDTFFSPTIDYFKNVFLKTLVKIGPEIGLDVLKRGYYPEGGARVKTNIQPAKIGRIDLTERGKLIKILIISGASESLKNNKVAERQIAGAMEILRRLKLPTEEKQEYYSVQSPGSNICLMAEFENALLGADNLGKLGKKAEDVGKEAALKLLNDAKDGFCLDRNLADQILPYMALSQSKSQVLVSEITNHCKTNIWVIEKFLEGKFETKDNLIVWNPKKL
ncbi:MAG: RNA 3'-terminal phosphate cyclase [Candidatus Pacebacteria bacterium]|nr:RNA 3'-terminal phosphate cyclase [Candidatus Paceibacterota bacterium]